MEAFAGLRGGPAERHEAPPEGPQKPSHETLAAVRPFELSLESDFDYFLVYSLTAVAQPKVKAFRDFLMAGKER